MIESLVTHQLPLRPLQREAYARVTLIRMDAQHMRTVFRAGTIGYELNARKAKYKANQFVVYVGADDETAIMHSCDQQVCGDDIRFAARPDSAL
jgi:hypothetical protein